MNSTSFAIWGGRRFGGLRDLTSDVTALDSSGKWIAVLPFEGPGTYARFQFVEPAPPYAGPPWVGPALESWGSSLGEREFEGGVQAIRQSIARGAVYQVNLTRRLSAPLPTHATPTAKRHAVTALQAALARGNPAPFSSMVCLPERDLFVASASPERFLSRHGGVVRSSPIKGTGRTPDDLLEKDRAENVMIVDLVRNDLGRVCERGSICVPDRLIAEPHPGLVHLVSTVEGRLRTGCGWAALLDAAFPPGSVTGAPKRAALAQIAALEPVPRGVYCGAIGAVDADLRAGDLAVAIRTFWIENDRLLFGTGAGITWDSTPEGEWAETELKARRLLSIASAHARS